MIVFKFDGLAVRAIAILERRSIRRSRLRGSAGAREPIPYCSFDHGGISISTRIRGIIPFAIFHERPVLELQAWIMAIGVIIEKIREREFAGGKRKAVARNIHRYLIERVREMHFAMIRKCKRLLQISASNRNDGCGTSDARRLSVWKSCNTRNARKPISASHLRIEIKTRATPETNSSKDGGSHRGRTFGLRT